MTVDLDKLPLEDKPADPTHNPLVKMMTTLQFQRSIRFYEADQALTPTDRQAMTSDLSSIFFRSLLVTSPAIALGVYLPTLIVRMRRKPAPYSGMLYRPFLSVVLGLLMARITNTLAVLYMLEQKAFTDGSPERRRVWSTMDFQSPVLFYMYFKRNASDPSFVFPDPRTVTKEEMQKAFAKKPCGEKLHEKCKQDSKDTSCDTSEDPSRLNVEAKSAWDKVRESGSKRN